MPQDSETAQWFDEKIRPHQPALRAWFRARFPTLTDPDDVLQDCYLRLLRAHETGTVKNSKAFLFTAVRNAALDILRRGRIVTMEPLVNATPSFVLENTPGVVETVCCAQEIEILHQAIEALPERCREIMTLQKIHNLSNREIATRLGLSVNTVNAQIVIGLVRCREYLRRHGVVRGRLS
ncbi:MAG: polymerase, sigma-24 subunit, subfamily [Verrucomicrobia bacterium]|nr:polymerase, sigma-24 subunit, subfamily [Verrucomicrobiota bacterium]